MSATRTFLGSVSWVDQNHFNSLFSRFIPDLPGKIVKCPRMELIPQALPNRYSRSYSLEVFKGNSHRVPLGRFNNFFGYLMVDIFGKSSFFFASFFQKVFGRLGSLGLKLCSKFKISNPNRADVRTTVNFFQAVSGDVGDAKIYPKILLNRNRFLFRNLTSGVEEKISIFIDQIRFTFLKFELFFLSFSTKIRKLFTTTNRPDRDLFIFPSQNSRVVGDGTMFSKFSDFFNIKFVAVSDLGYRSYNELSGEIKAISNRVVEHLVDIVLAKNLVFKSRFTNTIANFVKLLHSFKQRLFVFPRNYKFNLRSQFHDKNNNTRRSNGQIQQQWFWFSPNGISISLRPEGRSFQEII